MSCFRPVEAWYSRELNDSGKRPLVFSARIALERDNPITVPCGKCIGCVKDHANAWAVRCYHESTLHAQNSFLTLTYDDAHLPADGKLCKEHVQKYFKRARFHGLKQRYFYCGEYGSKTRRPHYHILTFGQDFLGGAEKFGDYYINPLLTDIWGLGHVTCAPMEPATTFYVAGYTLKNAESDDCFHHASTRPYIGAGWLKPFYDDIVRTGCVVIDGRRFPVPASYLRRPEYAAEFEQLKLDRAEALRVQQPKTRQQLEAAEADLRSRVRLGDNKGRV